MLQNFRALHECDDPLPRSLLLDWISCRREQGNQELGARLFEDLERVLGKRAGRPVDSPVV